jgi:2-dehydro-3-deoxy-D-arabinonate dehydratase
MPARICRFTSGTSDIRIGLVDEASQVRDLSAAGVDRFEQLLEDDDPAAMLGRLAIDSLPAVPLSSVQLCAPVERQEVWAAGVTYLRSKVARMEESDFSATAYDKVYEAERPEIFFKCVADKAVATGQPVGIRRDAKWSVPEPELALVLNSRGRIAGYTIGNDMSSRDIEGANLLYLPQAKIYDRSCALGPWITIGVSEADARQWTIHLAIQRDGATVFGGQVSVGQIKRRFDSLAEFLFRSQRFPHGAVLLTGTGVIPPDDFTLQPGDVVDMQISGIGSLTNSVMVV